MKCKDKTDKACRKEFKQFNSLQKYCSWECKNANEKPKERKVYKRPNKVSKKQAVINAKYSVLRIEFLGKKENQICPIKGTQATDVHHKIGRIGFADEWARLNNVPLTLDTRFWIALSREGHKKVEENPEWAKENGYSLNRL